MGELNDNFKGTGSMVEFVENVNMIARALNNAEVIPPDGGAGRVPTLRIEGGKLVLDMSSADFLRPHTHSDVTTGTDNTGGVVL